jgi:hypothetical protein
MRAQRAASCDEGTPLRALRRDHRHNEEEEDLPPDYPALVGCDASRATSQTELNHQEDRSAEPGGDMMQSTATAPSSQATSVRTTNLIRGKKRLLFNLMFLNIF